MFSAADAQASKPFESLYWVAGEGSGDWEDVFLPSGVLKETIMSWGYPLDGDWVGYWEHSGFMTGNPNGVLFAIAFGTFDGRIRGPDGAWYTGTVNFVVENMFKLSPDWSETYSIVLHWTILSGTGDLMNLRGHGTEDLDGNGTVWLHFEP